MKKIVIDRNFVFMYIVILYTVIYIVFVYVWIMLN